MTVKIKYHGRMGQIGKMGVVLLEWSSAML